MSRFHVEARRVRDAGLPFKVRRAALLSCVSRYCALAGGPPREVFSFYVAKYDLEESSLEVSDKLIEAINSLEAERNMALYRLQQFEKRRIREKTRGRRT